MTRKPQYNQGLSPTDRKRETERILVNYYGDDIANLYEDHESQEARLNAALIHREANQANITANSNKIEELFSSQQNIFDSIGQKADMGHKHSSTGGCPWYDIQCHLSEGFEGLGKLALIGGVAVVGIFLLKMRLGK